MTPCNACAMCLHDVGQQRVCILPLTFRRQSSRHSTMRLCHRCQGSSIRWRIYSCELCCVPPACGFSDSAVGHPAPRANPSCGNMATFEASQMSPTTMRGANSRSLSTIRTPLSVRAKASFGERVRAWVRVRMTLMLGFNSA